MHALKLDNNNRIQYACHVLPNMNYDGMPIVDTLPDGDITNYLFVEGKYLYDPLPEPKQPESSSSLESRVETLEEQNAELTEAVDMILSGVTE